MEAANETQEAFDDREFVLNKMKKIAKNIINEIYIFYILALKKPLINGLIQNTLL